MKYYKLTNETKLSAWGTTLFRIELTLDCKWGKAGTKGGWVEKEDNLKMEKPEDGFLFKGEIGGTAVIRGGVIRGGVIRGGVIRGGVIWGGVIRGGVIRGGVIWGGVIWGGEWHKSPLQIQGTKHFLNFGSKTELQIGCHKNTLEDWKKVFKQVGIENNYTELEIKEYKLYIDLAIKLQKLYKDQK